jgi:hypothetical protein
MKALDAWDFLFRCFFTLVVSECSRQLIKMANARCTKWMQTANTRMKTAVAVVLVAVLVGYAQMYPEKCDEQGNHPVCFITAGVDTVVAGAHKLWKFFALMAMWGCGMAHRRAQALFAVFCVGWSFVVQRTWDVQSTWDIVQLPSDILLKSVGGVVFLLAIVVYTKFVFSSTATATVIKCKGCSQHFTFTEGEKKFFADKGLTTPVRCKACRDARNPSPRKSPKGGGDPRDARKSPKGGGDARDARNSSPRKSPKGGGDVRDARKSPKGGGDTRDARKLPRKSRN